MARETMSDDAAEGQTTNYTPHIGDFVQDGRAEAEIVSVSPDKFEVVLQYTDTDETHRIQSNRIVSQNGELRVQ